MRMYNFVPEIYAKRLPTTYYAEQLKAGEIDDPMEQMKIFKAARVWYDPQCWYDQHCTGLC